MVHVIRDDGEQNVQADDPAREGARAVDDGKAPLALALAGVGGFVDVVGYLTLHHLFVAHMTGNTARLGVALGHGHLGAAVPYVAAVVAFVAGIALGTLALESRRGGRRAVLAIEVLLLAAFMVYGAIAANAHGGVAGRAIAPYYALAVLAIVAMGFQTSALTRVSGRTVRTTYISGVLTNMTRAALAREAARARLLAGVFACYLAGGVAGAFGHHAVGTWALAAPMCLVAGCAAAGSR